MRFRRRFINVDGGAKFHHGFFKPAFLQVFFAARDMFFCGFAAGSDKNAAQSKGKQQ
jgi:hypothetical protein